MKRPIATVAAAAAAFAAIDQAHAQSLSAEEAALLREEISLLRARVEQLERRLAMPDTAAAEVPGKPPAPPAEAKDKPALAIEWKGSPRVVQDDRTFKVKGRIQADANVVAAPKGLANKGLGFSSEFRRIRLGGEGKLGDGFGYKLELELSDNAVDLVDTFVTYERGPWLLTLGNHNAFQSLDELIGDTTGSFMERAAFNDAFGFERRLGASVAYQNGPVLAQLGVFTDDVGALANDSDGPGGGDENDSYSIDGRIVYAPKLAGAQLHIGASAHWRKLGRVGEARVRYRQRPFVHSTNSRLIGTAAIEVREERSHGLELGVVRGRWHAVAEGHWLRADRVAAGPVQFWGGYAEVGYFLTSGDGRRYGKGIFAAAAPKRSVAQGGIGAIQLNLRYDYLSLNSGDVRGGTQNAYLAALVWMPVQYLRLNLNYGYLWYAGAVPLPDGRSQYGLHMVGSRFELDF